MSREDVLFMILSANCVLAYLGIAFNGWCIRRLRARLDEQDKWITELIKSRSKS